MSLPVPTPFSQYLSSTMDATQLSGLKLVRVPAIAGVFRFVWLHACEIRQATRGPHHTHKGRRSWDSLRASKHFEGRVGVFQELMRH
jgi:hypothetical protein